MKKIKSDTIYGTVYMVNGEEVGTYDITEKSLSMETVNNTLLLNLWIMTSHFVEIEGVKSKIHITEIGFEVVCPVKEKTDDKIIGLLNIPYEEKVNLSDEEYFTTFYDNQYVFFVKVTLELERIDSDLYEVKFKGYPSYDNKEPINENYYIETTFKSILENKLKRRW